jgi:hypothetical protein
VPAVPAVPSVPADADPLADAPAGNTRADRVNDSCDFVPRHPRVLDVGPEALCRRDVAVAYATSLNLDPNLRRAGFRDSTFDEFELSLCILHLDGTHF